MMSLVDPPRVVGTVSPQGLAALARQSLAERAVDIIEARLDLALGAEAANPAGAALPELQPFLQACQELERSGTPVLATIRLTADGGRWPADAPRLTWFEQALDLVSWVDIEVDSAIADDVVGRAHARGRRVIVSHHDFTGTPDAAVLQALVDRARTRGGDVVKVATAIRGLEDHDRLVDLLRWNRATGGGALAVIGMGPLGTPLRSYLPCVGSHLTYGYLDRVAAPGQIPAPLLVQRLIADCPAYADARRAAGRL